jgi:hypothetical protein
MGGERGFFDGISRRFLKIKNVLRRDRMNEEEEKQRIAGELISTLFLASLQITRANEI